MTKQDRIARAFAEEAFIVHRGKLPSIDATEIERLLARKGRRVERRHNAAAERARREALKAARLYA